MGFHVGWHVLEENFGEVVVAEELDDVIDGSAHEDLLVGLGEFDCSETSVPEDAAHVLGICEWEGARSL